MASLPQARQCETSDDCPDHSPHCSDWGWCQWTDQYGTAGPSASPPDQDGACSSDEDCSPRFPVCSNLGYCTVKDYFEKSGVPREDDKGGLTRKERPRNGQRSIGGRGGRRQPNGSHQNNLRNNRNNNNIQKQQQATTAALPEATATAGQQLPVPGIRQNGQQRDYDDSYDDRKSATSSEAAVAARDYYENYDYNYYTQFEVLRNQEDDRGDKSIEHKIHQQFIGSTQSRDSARGRPQNSRGRPQNTRVTSVNPVDNSNEGNESSDQVTLTSANVTGGCLNDCVNDCVSIAQLTAYRDCVGFCGKTCKD